jgi:hypothetical protein
MDDREREDLPDEKEHGHGPLEALKDYAEHAVKVLEPRKSDVRATPVEPGEGER